MAKPKAAALPVSTNQVQFGGISSWITDWVTRNILSSIHFAVDAATLKTFIADIGKMAKGLLKNTDPAVMKYINDGVDAVVKNVDDLIDKWLASAPVAPVTPGSITFSAAAPVPTLTTTDVQNYLDAVIADEKSDGHAAPQFNAQCVSLMMANPQLVLAMKHLSRKKQLKALGDLNIMSQILDFLTRWGPTLLSFISIILPFLI